MIDKRKLRKRLEDLFRVESDFDAMLIDRFDDVYRKLPANPTRNDKVNLLFTLKGEAEIVCVLSELGFEIVPTAQRQSGGQVDSEELAKYRQEIARLQQIIREREQQLSGTSFESSIPAKTALGYFSICVADAQRMIDGSCAEIDGNWEKWVHSTLDTLERSLGQFHPVSNDFRYRFLVAREPMSRIYLQLLSAAQDLLTKRYTEEQRRQAEEQRTLAEEQRSMDALLKAHGQSQYTMPRSLTLTRRS